MNAGSLSRYFRGVGAKEVTGTEVDPSVSNGHEFQGVDAFRAFLGTPGEKAAVPVNWVWLEDGAEPFAITAPGTWYDSRRGKGHRGPEYRLYYPASAEEVVFRSRPGDTLFLCMPHEGNLLALLCAQGSTIEQQLLWLFDVTPAGKEIVQRDLREDAGRVLDLAARHVLDLIDIEVSPASDRWLDRLLTAFPSGLPSTQKFSAFARKEAAEVGALTDPDNALLAWMDLEEELFLTFERHIVGERLKAGFVIDGVADVEGFVSYSLHVHNRRKSRAGYALGHHVEALLKLHGITFKREATTEKRNGPDFLFPGEAAYHDASWPAEKLLMLGVKTSCKDRWRQVLAEADRIRDKHLLTLEPGISPAQTEEMAKERLTLVLPRSLHETYRPEQRDGMLSVAHFMELTREITAGATGEPYQVSFEGLD